MSDYSTWKAKKKKQEENGGSTDSAASSSKSAYQLYKERNQQRETRRTTPSVNDGTYRPGTTEYYTSKNNNINQYEKANIITNEANKNDPINSKIVNNIMQDEIEKKQANLSRLYDERAQQYSNKYAKMALELAERRAEQFANTEEGKKYNMLMEERNEQYANKANTPTAESDKELAELEAAREKIHQAYLDANQAIVDGDDSVEANRRRNGLKNLYDKLSDKIFANPTYKSQNREAVFKNPFTMDENVKNVVQKNAYSKYKEFVNDNDRTYADDVLKYIEGNLRNALEDNIPRMAVENVAYFRGLNPEKAWETYQGEDYNADRYLTGQMLNRIQGDPNNQNYWKQLGLELAGSFATNLPGYVVGAAVGAGLGGAAMAGATSMAEAAQGLETAQSVANTASAVVLGMQMAGSAYNEARDNGHDISQANWFALEQGLEEFATDKLIGLAGQRAGSVLGNSKILTQAKEAAQLNAKTAFGKFALKSLAGMGAEGLPEYAQEFLQYYTENASREVFLKENAFAGDMVEDLKLANHAGWVGFLNALIMGAPNVATNFVSTVNEGKNSDTRIDVLAILKDQVDLDKSHYKDFTEYYKAQNLYDLLAQAEHTYEKGNELSNLLKGSIENALNEYYGAEYSTEYQSQMDTEYEEVKATEQDNYWNLQQGYDELSAQTAQQTAEMPRNDNLMNLAENTANERLRQSDEIINSIIEGDVAKVESAINNATLLSEDDIRMAQEAGNELREEEVARKKEEILNQAKEQSDESISQGQKRTDDMGGFTAPSESETRSYFIQQGRIKSEIKDIKESDVVKRPAREVISAGTDAEMTVLSDKWVNSHKWARKLVADNAAQGIKTILSLGEFKVYEHGNEVKVRGYISDDGKTIAISISDDMFTAEQVNKHERFHAIRKKNPNILSDIRAKLKNYTDEQLNQMAEDYATAYGIVMGDDESVDDFYEYVMEEIYADIYADMVISSSAQSAKVDIETATRESLAESNGNEVKNKGEPRLSRSGGKIDGQEKTSRLKEWLHNRNSKRNSQFKLGDYKGLYYGTGKEIERRRAEISNLKNVIKNSQIKEYDLYEMGFEKAKPGIRYKIVPYTMLTPLMKDIYSSNLQKGIPTHFVFGRIKCVLNGVEGYACGLRNANRIVLQADNNLIPLIPLNRHEVFHTLVNKEEVIDNILNVLSFSTDGKKITQEEFNKVLIVYENNLHYITDFQEAYGDLADWVVYDEIFADGYAGHNEFLGVDDEFDDIFERISLAVQSVVEENGRFFANSVQANNEKVGLNRYSRSAIQDSNFNDLYTVLNDGRIKINNIDDLSTEDWKLIYKTVNRLGYGLESVEQAKEAFSRFASNHGFNEEQSKAIMKAYGVLEEEVIDKRNPERVKVAKKLFGTTNDFREAGYLLTDGYMLDFSGKKDGGMRGQRAMDHREISPVFKDGEVETEAYSITPYMNAFISEGNIRLMDSQGVTIGQIEPSAKQYTVLKRFIDYVLKEEGYFYLDLSNDNGNTIESREYGEGDTSTRIINDIKGYFKNGELPYRSELQQYRYSRSANDYAPVFYSKLQQEVENYKGDKLGAASVVSYFTGKGVKEEEIKWSGIRTFLEGKKSVSKSELMDYLKTNELQIEEKTLDGTETTKIFSDDDDKYVTKDEFIKLAIEASEIPNAHAEFIENPGGNVEVYVTNTNGEDYSYTGHYEKVTGDTQWSGYKLDGGENYREILFKMPNSDYSNKAMQTHWKETGVLAHARIQDFYTPEGKKVLFIDEIQSDWHNAGKKEGYVYEPIKITNENSSVNLGNENGKDGYILKVNYRPIDFATIEDIEEWGSNPYDLDEVKEYMIQRYEENNEAATGNVPDAPFAKNYTDYVLKVLLRQAAEGDYDYLAWTTGKMQEDRWSSEYAEGYRIEYDQDIPKFLNKYGKQWNTKNEMISIGDDNHLVAMNFADEWRDYWENRGFTVDDYFEKQGWLVAELSNGEQKKIRRGEIVGSNYSYTVPAIPLNDEMKQSVLYVGQTRFSRSSVQDSKHKIAFGSMFSGAGTVDFALRNMIYNQFAVEYDSAIAAVYKNNNGDDIYVGDVRDAINDGYLNNQNIDYLHASPVCKNFSKQKVGAEETPIDIETARAVAEAINKNKPKIVTIENVKGYKNSKALRLIKDALTENGYIYDEDVYRASDYGGATIRDRYFLRAVKDATEMPPKPKKKSGKSWYEVTKDLIPELNEMPFKKDSYLKKRWDAIKKDVDTSKPVLLLYGTKGEGIAYAEADDYSPTIIAHTTEARIAMPDGRFLEVTPRVLARIQGLPDSFELPTQKTLGAKVVGNGVPVQLTQAVAGSLMKEIEGVNRVRFSRSNISVNVEDSERTYVIPSNNIQIIKNPTTEEYQALRKAFYDEYSWLRGTGEPPVRHTYDKEGNTYYFSSEVLHSTVEPYINKHWNTETNQQYNWWEDKGSDIRFSRSENRTAMEELENKVGVTEGAARRYESLLASSPELRAASEKLTRALSAANYTVVKEDVKTIAKYIMDYVGSNAPKTKVVAMLGDFYQYIHDQERIDGAEITRIAHEIADLIIKDSAITYDPYMVDEYNSFKKELKKYKIAITPAVIEAFGDKESFAAFRKANRNTIEFSNKGQDIDVVYQDLLQYFSDVLDRDANYGADQMNAILDALDRLEPTPILEGEDYDLKVQEVADKIYSAYFDTRFNAIANVKDARTYIKEYNDAITEFKRKERERNDAYYESIKKKNDKRFMEYQYKTEKRIGEARKYNDKQSAKKTIVSDVKALSRWLTNPNDKQHIPESIRKPLAQFLSFIDFSTEWKNREGEETQRTLAWRELKDAWQKIANEGKAEDGTYFEVDPDLQSSMDEITSRLQEVKKLDDLTFVELQELRDIVKSMKKMIDNANKMITSSRGESVAEVAGQSMNELNSLREHKEFAYPAVKWIVDMTKNKMLSADTRFHLFGKQAEEVYSRVREGFNKKVRHTQEAAEYFAGLKEKYNVSDKEIREWGNEKAVKIGITTEAGAEISLRPAQVMSLYELWKRPQSRKHIEKGGVISRTVEVVGKHKEYVKTAPVKLNENDVKALTDQLTDTQRQFADGIAEFFKTTAKWGNDASMLMFGYRKFKDANYFPIEVDRNTIATRSDGNQNQDTVAIKNAGFTKETKKDAQNALYVNDIIDVFTEQVNGLSNYDAFLAPMSDLLKWFNYQDENGNTIKRSIERAFGADSLRYVLKLKDDINGYQNTDTYFANNLIGRVKGSAVGANLSVMIQQPTAYARALAVMDGKYLLKGLSFEKATVGDWENVLKYSMIAQWKAWGFYETDIGKSMRTILTSSENFKGISTKRDFKEWLNTKQMTGAEKGDEIAWMALWKASEAQVEDTTDLKPGTEEFFKEVAKVFDNIIDRTQVVDSLFSRADVMRNKDALSRMATSFMNEPMKSYNSIAWALYDATTTEGRSKTKAKKMLTAAVIGWLVSQTLAAACKSLITALRDKDKDKTYLDRWSDAFIGDYSEVKDFGDVAKEFFGSELIGNLNPLSYIPFIKDLLSLAQGYDVSRMDVQGFTAIIDAVKRWFNGKYTVASNIIYSMKAVSNLTGIAISNLLRDFDAIITEALYAMDAQEAIYHKERALGKTIEADKTNYAKMALKAYTTGNTSLGDEIVQDMIDAGVKEKSIKTAIGAESEKDENGNTIDGSMKKDFIEKIIANNTSATTAAQAYKAAYPDDKDYDAWIEAGYNGYDYMKHWLNLQNFTGDKKQEDVVNYIKKNVKGTDKQKLVWKMAGYKLDSESKGKVTKDGNFNKKMGYTK